MNKTWILDFYSFHLFIRFLLMKLRLNIQEDGGFYPPIFHQSHPFTRQMDFETAMLDRDDQNASIYLSMHGCENIVSIQE